MAVSPNDDWFFVRNRERHGPVPLAKLWQLAKTAAAAEATRSDTLS